MILPIIIAAVAVFVGCSSSTNQKEEDNGGPDVKPKDDTGIDTNGGDVLSIDDEYHGYSDISPDAESDTSDAPDVYVSPDDGATDTADVFVNDTDTFVPPEDVSSDEAIVPDETVSPDETSNDTPITNDTPVTENVQASEDVPITIDTPLPEDLPIADDASTADDDPQTTEVVADAADVQTDDGPPLPNCDIENLFLGYLVLTAYNDDAKTFAMTAQEFKNKLANGADGQTIFVSLKYFSTEEQLPETALKLEYDYKWELNEPTACKENELAPVGCADTLIFEGAPLDWMKVWQLYDPYNPNSLANLTTVTETDGTIQVGLQIWVPPPEETSDCNYLLQHILY